MVSINFSLLFKGWILPVSSDRRESSCNAGDLGFIPGLGRSSEEGDGNPLQYSCLENPMDRGTWRATVHGVTKSRTYHIVMVSAIHQYESAIGIHEAPPSWTSFTPPTPTLPSRLLQSTGLSSLCHTANSQWLSILHMVIYVSMPLSLFVPPSLFPCCVHRSALYVCISFAALQIGSSVQILYSNSSFTVSHIPRLWA